MTLVEDDEAALTRDEVLGELDQWEALQLQGLAEYELMPPHSKRQIEESAGDHEVTRLGLAKMSLTTRRRVLAVVRSAAALLRSYAMRICELERKVEDLEARLEAAESCPVTHSGGLPCPVLAPAPRRVVELPLRRPA